MTENDAPPAGACDCHAHVFGPYDRFPVTHAMHYEPPTAPASAYDAMLSRVRLARGVLIQPGAYGCDPSAIISALEDSGGRLRGIAAATPEISEKQFDAWHAAGIRGLRFNETLAPTGERFAGAVGVDALTTLAPRLRARGWHAEIWAPIDRHAALLPLYRGCGLSIVLDHLGSVRPERGVQDPAFQAVRAAIDDGWLWIKLVVCRASQAFPNYADLRPFHDALVETNSDRLVWGSDWPHLRLGERTPDVAHLLDIFRGWTPDDGLQRRILVDNPRELYCF